MRSAAKAHHFTHVIWRTRTHVYFVPQPVVYDFYEPHDVGVAALFHDRYFPTNFGLGGAQFVTYGQVR